MVTCIHDLNDGAVTLNQGRHRYNVPLAEHMEKSNSALLLEGPYAIRADDKHGRPCNERHGA
jgi:hypothetical protein